MSSRKDAEMELEICKSVIAELSDDNLKNAKKFFELLSESKRLSKLYGTYIEGVETSLANTMNGKMYTNFNLDGTVTGRLSNSGALGRRKDPSSKLGVSFHTLPREQEDFNIRNYVIAPPGWDFITVDLKAAELRVLAHVANEKKMISAFKNGQDLHDFTTEMVYGIKKHEVPKEEWKFKRQICKEVSFLTVYGGTAYTLANKRNIPEAQAERIIKSWFETFPGVKEYMGTIEDYIKQHKYAKTIFGRFRHLPNIDSPVKSIRNKAFRQGLNYTIQSPASDILCCGIVGVDRKLKGMQARIVCSVHDSLEVVCPKDETRRVVELVSDELINCHYMRDTFNIELKVPIEVDIEVGTSFGNGKPYSLTAS